MTVGYLRRGIPAPYALPVSFAAFLAIGTLAAALHGHLDAAGVLIACAIVAGLVSFAAAPAASIPIAAIGWLTVAGFSRPPYADLRPTAATARDAAIAIGTCSLACAALGVLFRWQAGRLTLVRMGSDAGQRTKTPAMPGPADQAGDVPVISLGRRLASLALAVAALPLMTYLLATWRGHLNLADDVLVYLVVVVTITVLGGFWPAVLAAIAASLLLNWYFTEPLHTFAIQEPRELLALLLFVTVAVAVSSVVHLAARRAIQAAHSKAEAQALLELAQTILGGADTPAAVLTHLTATHGGQAELQEKTGGRWIRAASSGAGDNLQAAHRLDIRQDLALRVTGQSASATPALLAGFAAQAAAALDRERLRTQAAQAEALAEGNRMRTALLAAVSHDLRTPLASIKASVSSLRQTDVAWSAEDEAELLATIEENADRLDALIGNLLDMSRLHTGSLQPFLRPTAIDEVAPVALHHLDDSSRLNMAVPDGFPLVLADPGLLERVLANLFSNALRHSPASQAPELHARLAGTIVLLEVVDHGHGVPDDQKERIFEPFARLDDRVPGVGLGLAVAKGFAEAMGGGISAQDTPGGGLTVLVALPAASSDKSGDKSMLGAGS
jgi:two-component system sensor histidine kinase KdpD